VLSQAWHFVGPAQATAPVKRTAGANTDDLKVAIMFVDYSHKLRTLLATAE
jgi:hypothetical protein